MFLNTLPLLAAGSSAALFRMVLPYALLAVVVLMVLHFVIALVLRGAPAERSRWNLWDLLIYLGLVGCIGVLAVTSFAGVLLHGELGGWALFLHMCGAGAFTAVLPLSMLSWAHINKFDIPQSQGKSPAPKFYWLPKSMFWVIAISGLVVTMTMLVSMLPIFGTDGLLKLLDLHRYSGLLVVMAAALHFYGVAAGRLGLR